MVVPVPSPRLQTSIAKFATHVYALEHLRLVSVAFKRIVVRRIFKKLLPSQHIVREHLPLENKVVQVPPKNVEVEGDFKHFLLDFAILRGLGNRYL